MDSESPSPVPREQTDRFVPREWIQWALTKAWDWLFKEKWKKVGWSLLLGDGGGGAGLFQHLLTKELLLWALVWTLIWSAIAVSVVIKIAALRVRSWHVALSVFAFLTSIAFFYLANWFVKENWVSVGLADFVYFWIVPPIFGLSCACLSAVVGLLLFRIEKAISPFLLAAPVRI